MKKKAALISGISVISFLILALTLTPHLQSSPQVPEQADFMNSLPPVLRVMEHRARGGLPDLPGLPGSIEPTFPTVPLLPGVPEILTGLTGLPGLLTETPPEGGNPQ